MAENRKYKYKTDEIDSELFKKNLLSNYESYVKHQGYKGDELTGFKTAFDNYLKALDDGALSTEYDGSITDITGRLKNEGFNQHVAKYFNTVGNAVNQKTTKATPVKKTKFSLDEHGFWNAFGKHIAPSGNGDLEAWLNQDAYDETSKKRGLSNRVTHFNDFLDQYIANFGDYDFEGTAFKDKEDYLGRLRKVKTALADNTLSENEYLVLNQAGLDPNSYKAAFTTDKTYVPTSSTGAGTQDQTDTELKTYLQESKAKWDNSRISNAAASYIHNSDLDSEKYRASDEDKQKVLNFLTDGSGDYNFALSYLSQYESIPETQGDYTGWKILPSTFNEGNQSVLIVNPQTQKYKREFIGMIPTFMNQQLEKRKRNQNPDFWMSSYTSVKKEGGKFQEGGSIEDFVNQSFAEREAEYDRALEKRAEAAGETTEYIRNKERSVGRKSASLSDKDSEWSGLESADYAQLATIAADLYSGLADPLTGTIAGVGSSITQAGLDLYQGRGLWETTKSLAGNLALDALSIIPVVGDAVGSGSKVVKGLTKFSSKLLPLFASGVSVAGLGSTFQAAYDSLSKIGKDGKENEFTVDDFRNIADGISLLMQGKRGISNWQGQKQSVKNATMADTVDVRVKQNGTEKILRFSDKAIVDKLKAAKNPKEVNDIIKKNAPTSYQNAEVMTESDGEGGWQWIWKRGTTDGKKNSFWSFDNFRSPLKKSGQKALMHDAIDYDQLRTRQKAWGSPNWGSNVDESANVLTRTANKVSNPFTWDSQVPVESVVPVAPVRPSNSSKFAKLRQLSTKTTPLTDSEIKLINKERSRRGLGELSEAEIKQINTRRENRKGVSSKSIEDRLVDFKNKKQDEQLAIQRAREAHDKTLAVPQNDGSLLQPPTGQEIRDVVRQTNAMVEAIPTVGRAPISNPPAIIPKATINNPFDAPARPKTFEEIATNARKHLELRKQQDEQRIIDKQNDKIANEIADAREARAKERENFIEMIRKARQDISEGKKRERTSRRHTVGYEPTVESPKAQPKMTKKEKAQRQKEYEELFGLSNGYNGEVDLYTSDFGKTKTPYRFNRTRKHELGGLLIPKAEGGAQVVANGRLRRLGKGTPEDPYRYEAVEGTGSVVHDANQTPEVVNSQFLPSKAEVDKIVFGLNSSNIQQYVKPEDEETDKSMNKNPLENVKMSKVLDFLKYTSQKEHNKKQLDLALARPTRNDQIAQDTESVIIGQDDLRVEAERQAAQLMNVAKNSATTDSLENREIMLKAAIAGNEGKMKQAIVENTAVAAAREKNLATRNKNALARVQGTNANNYYALLKKDDDYKATAAFNQANNLSDVNMLDNLIKEAKNREIPEDTGAELKEMQESVKMQNYQTEILKDPAAHGLQFDDATTKVVQDVFSKTRKASDLSPEEYASYERAVAQINQMIKVKMARDKHLNLNFNPTPIETPFTTVVTGLPTEKDGGKITVAKIKKKIEKAKLQQRQLEDKMKNYQKDLDRLSRRSDTYKKEK